MTSEKEENIKESKKHIGWAYSYIKKLSSKELERANKERDVLLKSCESKGAKYYLHDKYKIHSYNLSPGCRICAEGIWSCLFFTKSCTRRCFFCPQKMEKIFDKSRPTQTGYVKFYSSKDYVGYLKKFNFKGVGFSGGEPLLAFKKLLDYIKEIKKCFGKSFYLWLYTNGDLITVDKLKKLKNAGLNEIRFDLAARDYSLKPIKLAVKFFDIVTVETPAIPEDFDIIKKSLKELERIGVTYVNLHQLTFSRYNYNNFIKRNYALLHSSQYSVYESEITALRLLEYALKEGLNLPINYCSSGYKYRFQSKGIRERINPHIMKTYEAQTKTGIIRKMFIEDLHNKIKGLIKNLDKNKVNKNFWLVNKDKTKVFVHHSILENIDFTQYKLSISYFDPHLLLNKVNPEEDYCEIKINSNKSVFVKKKKGPKKTLNSTAVKFFLKLFIENLTEKETEDYFFKKYKLNKKDSIEFKNFIKNMGNKFINLEYFEKEFSEIY